MEAGKGWKPRRKDEEVRKRGGRMMERGVEEGERRRKTKKAEER